MEEILPWVQHCPQQTPSGWSGVGIGLLALDGICGLGFWGAVGHQAMKTRFFLILVPGEAKPLGVPREQKTCCSQHLSLAPTSTAR